MKNVKWPNQMILAICFTEIIYVLKIDRLILISYTTEIVWIDFKKSDELRP